MKKNDIIIPLLCIAASVCIGATIRVPVNLRSFNAGELSPLMNARSDYPKYASGAKTLQNMLVKSQGPITRRPGTKYIASAKDAGDETRLIPFQYSTEDTYIIEAGDDYFRFYRNGGQILDGASPYEIVSPYDSNDIFEVQWAQDAQIMRMVHPDYPPYKLTRTAHTSWTVTAIDFQQGPFIPQNTDTTLTITPSAITGVGITLTASAALFDVSDHVGASWEIVHIVDANNVSGAFVLNWVSASNPPSATLDVELNRYYDFSTSGRWNGTVHLERSYDDGSSWEDVTIYTSQNDGNVQWSGQEVLADALYRVSLDDGYTLTDRSYCIYNVTARAFKHHGIVDITAVATTTSATATVVTDLASTDATYRHSESYWSPYRGYPRTVAYHEQRCVYGGSEGFPQTVWGSVVADQDSEYDNFSPGLVDDDDSWFYILPGMNPIQWMNSQEFLMIGTTSGVGRMGNRTVAITPTSIEYKVQPHSGCEYIQSVDAADGILFVERGGQKVRELSYTSLSERYIANDMTVLAEHITGDGIVEIDFQYRPDPILWCVRDDGQLLSFTYQPRHDIDAWTRQTTDGNFESVAVIPGSSDEDEVWAVANRTIDSNTVLYIEQFQPHYWADQNDAWYVDSGGTSVSSLSWLEGEEVVVLADARPLPDTYTVSGGAITLSGYTNYVIGLPYTSVYESMPVTVESEGLSTALMKTAILQVNMDFQDTLACNLGTSATTTSPILFSEDDFATTMDAFTGIKTATFPRGVSRDTTIYIDANEPAPMTIRSLNPTVNVMVD